MNSLQPEKKILVVDDDLAISKLLAQFLNKNGFEVAVAHNGREMFKFLRQRNFDLIILDLMLPGEDGLSLFQKLRTFCFTPVIMLTAKAEETERIIGLEMGADDYICKPFSPRELLARIKAVARRNLQTLIENINPDVDIFHFADGWKLDKLKRQLLSPDDIEITLSAGEFNLLIAFLERPQRTLNRDQLLDITKNRLQGPYDRSIDIQISRLRQKIEKDPKNPHLLKTVRSKGYIFACSVKREVGAECD